MTGCCRFLLTLCLLGTGCISSGGPDEVVVYTALDREFSEPIFRDFERETGIRVLAKYDVESTKTVGLAQALFAEAARPRCDVFWNNEILNTLRLGERELLAPYPSPAADPYPAMYRGQTHTWHGFAGRARVLLVNTERVAEADRPTSLWDLTDPRWRGQIAIAKPLFGTTATHAACLFAHLGPEEARRFFRELKANEVQIVAGNKQVALDVAAGAVAWGLTDTDDAMIEVERGAPVVIVYPDRQPDQMGTLFIPNTVSMIRGGPHPDHARRLIDYLLSPEVETKLSRAASAQIPLNPRVNAAARVETPRTVHAMPVDFAQAAAHWDEVVTFLRDDFLSDAISAPATPP